MKIYIISSLRNADRVKSIRDRLSTHGISLTYDWTTHGQIIDAEGRKKAAEGERQGVRDAKCILMLLPCRKGSHVELGIALENDKPVVMLNDVNDEDVLISFYALDGIIHCDSEDDAISNVIRITHEHT